MNLYLKIFALCLLVSAPFLTQAAEPVLSIRDIDGRTLHIRYAHLDNARLVIEDKAGAMVGRAATLPRTMGTKTITLPKTIKGGEYVLSARTRDGEVLAKQSFTLTAEPPTCTLKASEKAIKKGEQIRLRWTSENADRAKLFGSKEVAVKGSERVSMYHAGTRGFALNLMGKGGIGSCSVKVQVKE